MSGGTWSLGTIVWLPTLVLLVTGLLVLARFFRVHEWDRYDAGMAKGARIGCFVVAGLFIAGTAFGMYPYKAEYHQWRNVSGTVGKIDHRLIGSGSGMEDKFVVRFTSGGQQYGCDDTRCAQVEKGDRLTLSCKRAWQYTGTDGYDCRFVSTEAAS